MRILCTALLGLALSAAPALAQHWITPETCDLSGARIHDEVLPQAELKALQAEAARVPFGLGRFWKVTAPSGAVSYVWGTFHSNDPAALALPEPVLDAVAGARLFMPEIDAVAPSRRSLEQRQHYDYGYKLTPGPHKGLAPETIEYLGARLQTLGFDREYIGELTLTALAEIVLSDPCLDFARGVYPIQDDLVQLEAAKSGVIIKPLENEQDLLEFLSRTANAPVAEALINTNASAFRPEGFYKARQTGFTLTRQGQTATALLWERADLQALFGMERGAQMQDQMDSYMLVHRNAVFFDAARAELEQGGAFLSVGAFHLPGEEGLLALIEQAGFKVSRIPVPGELTSYPQE